MAIKSQNSICVIAIIVTYNPDADVLRKVVMSIRGQADGVVIVDNGSVGKVVECLGDVEGDNINWLLLGSNYGIARAQNTGIEWARAHNATHVILLDQDSIPFGDMVSRLLSEHQALVSRKVRVSAVGPLFLDSDSGASSSFTRFGKFGMKQIECPAGSRSVEVDVLLASGSLISIDVLDEVGGMDESLFIDYVDTEWILRARQKNYLAFGVCDAYMSHRLGENRKKLWFLRWRYLPMHKPFRFYYIFRNAIQLMRRKNANRDWRRCETINLLRLALMFGLFVSPRFDYIRMIMTGIAHGFLGRSGSLENTRHAGAD